MTVKKLIEMLEDVNQDTEIYAYITTDVGWKICPILYVGHNEDQTLLSVPIEDRTCEPWENDKKGHRDNENTDWEDGIERNLKGRILKL